MGIRTSTWCRCRQLIVVLVPSFVTCTKLSSALCACRRPPSPGHFPLSTTPHLPTPLTTRPFLLPSVPPKPKGQKNISDSATSRHHFFPFSSPSQHQTPVSPRNAPSSV